MKNLSVHIKSFQEISSEYEFTYRNIDVKTSFYNKLIANGRNVPSAGSYYSYSSLTEARELRRKLKSEIDRKFTLELTSAFEAKLVYYFRNVLKRGYSLHSTYRSSVSGSVRIGGAHLMYHHLLDVFKQEIQPLNNVAYANLKNLVDYRNWLAHGRGWDFENHLSVFDFEYSYRTIEEIIKLLPNFPEKLK